MYSKLYIFLRIFLGAKIENIKNETIKIISTKSNIYGVIPNTRKDEDIK